MHTDSAVAVPLSRAFSPQIIQLLLVEQSEVAVGDAADGGDGLRVRKVSTVKGQAQCAPVARQHKRELIALQRTGVRRETDTARELRITRHTFLDARHANAHQAESRAINHVTQLFDG